MTDIRHHIGIEAPQAQVHQALSTTAGVASWWTTDADGDASRGGKLLFYFGSPDPRVVVEVIDVTPDRIEWSCVGGPDEWLGTMFTFELAHDAGETTVLFTHGGWREANAFQAHCSTKWAYFLLGLKSLVEDGAGTPYPGDRKIGRWG